MDYVLSSKIRIGISACNYGAKVRWNAAGWDRVEMLGRSRSDYIWTPVCPEVQSGLGVPRDPMKLSGGNGDDFWAGKARMKNKKGRDVSAQVKEGALAVLACLKRADVDAFAFMEGSPSCGVYRTTLKDRRLGKPPGAFGSLLLKEDIFLIPALDLESPWKWWDWSRRLQAFVWLKRVEISSKKDLYEAWHALKFICQEASRKESDLIGQSLAAAPAKLTREFVAEWKSRTLRQLRRPSTLARIEAVMTKHFAHYRKTFAVKAADLAAPSKELSRHVFIAELEKMERQAAQTRYLFAGRPVLYKPER